MWACISGIRARSWEAVTNVERPYCMLLIIPGFCYNAMRVVYSKRGQGGCYRELREGRPSTPSGGMEGTGVTSLKKHPHPHPPSPASPADPDPDPAVSTSVVYSIQVQVQHPGPYSHYAHIHKAEAP